MTRPSRMLAAAALATAVIGAVAMHGAAAPEPPITVPAVQFVGFGSRVTEPRFVVIRDESAWNALWAEHSGSESRYVRPSADQAPRIDFARFMVVGAFGGGAVNTDGNVAQGVFERDGAVVVRYEPSTFQTSGADGGGRETTPYGLWVIDRRDMPVVIEKGVRHLKADPLEWKPVHLAAFE